MYKDILIRAHEKLEELVGQNLKILSISKPTNLDYAYQLSKVISKLSPILGNMIEYASVDILNTIDWKIDGVWIRQDPGFPDALFKSSLVFPNPGIEIKTWFPFATEITARFKDSVSHFADDQVDVALIAWLPENIIWGEPTIIDICTVPASSVARARDLHYHNPPGYLVVEPEDTSLRTNNLQQTNTNGYKFQGNNTQLIEAQEFAKLLDISRSNYDSSKDYQNKVKQMLSKFNYRLDTNFAKIDRIEHIEIELFKTKVLKTIYKGKTIEQWSKLFSSNDVDQIKKELELIL